MSTVLITISRYVHLKVSLVATYVFGYMWFRLVGFYNDLQLHYSLHMVNYYFSKRNSVASVHSLFFQSIELLLKSLVLLLSLVKFQDFLLMLDFDFSMQMLYSMYDNQLFHIILRHHGIFNDLLFLIY